MFPERRLGVNREMATALSEAGGSLAVLEGVALHVLARMRTRSKLVLNPLRKLELSSFFRFFEPSAAISG
jgi:hypothetical protein